MWEVLFYPNSLTELRFCFIYSISIAEQIRNVGSDSEIWNQTRLSISLETLTDHTMFPGECFSSGSIVY